MTAGILAWLAAMRDHYLANPGRVLEVGSFDVNGSPRSVFQATASEYLGVNQQAGPGVDRVLNAHNLSQAITGPFDLIVCCEMLEHDPSPWISVEQMRRLLRPGGCLILTSPANGFPLHRYPRDYWRFMPDVYEDVFLAGLDILERHTTPDPCSCYLARSYNPEKFDRVDQPPSYILRHCGSDKESLHHYGRMYDSLLNNKRDASAVLEIGVDTGRSLLAWSSIFPRAQIVGIDIRPLANCLSDVPRSHFIQLDAGNSVVLSAFAAANRSRFSLIVDDASHEPAHQLLTHATLRSALTADGVLVIEDVYDDATCAVLVAAAGRVWDNRQESGHPYSRAVSFASVG